METNNTVKICSFYKRERNGHCDHPNLPDKSCPYLRAAQFKCQSYKELREPLTVKLFPEEIESLLIMMGMSAIQSGNPVGPFQRFVDHFHDMCKRHPENQVMELVGDHAINGMKKLICSFDQAAEAAGYLEES